MKPGMFVGIGDHAAATWAESYTLAGGHATHQYTDGPLVGHPAVVRHGHATTIGAWSASLIREVLTGLLAEVGVATIPLPEGVRIARRGRVTTYMNFNEAAVALPDGTVLPPVSFELRE
jgi:beta-galactosidase